MAADFSMTADLLAAHRIPTSVSEIHGVLSGQICAYSAAFDLDLSVKILEIPNDTKEVITNLLKMLAEDILSQLKTENYAFELLLPDADEEFSQRLIALSHWCDGFNAGFAGAWVRDDSAMETDTREVLSDFSRIAEVDEENEEASESDNEINFMEIEEYVRMAAITVFLQNNVNQAPPVTLDINVPDENTH
jgi:uncharacterized protein YgfB (UPF0149 family)